jgi:hypothetical protein
MTADIKLWQYLSFALRLWTENTSFEYWYLGFLATISYIAKHFMPSIILYECSKILTIKSMFGSLV